MTIQELIAELAKWPSDALVDSYAEDGRGLVIIDAGDYGVLGHVIFEEE